jgi:hypothetical protein
MERCAERLERSGLVIRVVLYLGTHWPTRRVSIVRPGAAIRSRRGPAPAPLAAHSRACPADHQVTHLGYYRTEEEAARVYDKVSISLHGDNAQTNFPIDQVRRGMA